MPNPSTRGVLSVRFNQDHGCFICCMESGLKIYNVDPLTEKMYLNQEMVGSIAHAEMLNRTNLIAIVGGGSKPSYAEYSVLVLDDSRTKDKVIFDMTFAQPVLAVRLRNDMLVAVLRNEIHVFSFPNKPQLLCSFITFDNQKGLCELGQNIDTKLLVFPSHKIGSIQIVDLNSNQRDQSTTPHMIPAHRNDLAAICLNQSGSIVATASKQGTLIRVYEVATKRKLTELRRGADSAMLYCLAFSSDSAFLCSASDKGTVHIFAVRDPNLNTRSSLQMTGFLGTYGESQFDMARFTVPAECACVCAFGPGKSVIAVCVDGSFHKYSYTLEGGCTREAYDVYLDMEGENAPF